MVNSKRFLRFEWIWKALISTFTKRNFDLNTPDCLISSKRLKALNEKSIKKHRKHSGDFIVQYRHLLHRMNDNRHQSSCLILSSVWKCFIINFFQRKGRKKIRNIAKSNMEWGDIEPTLGRWLTTTDWPTKRIFIKAILKTLNSLICNDWLQQWQWQKCTKTVYCACRVLTLAFLKEHNTLNKTISAMLKTTITTQGL